MADPGLTSEFGPIWAELDEGLWHTTHPERFLGVRKAGAIMPEPSIPDAERWGTSQGPQHYPYVRYIGGVSLFDFEGFHAETYRQKYLASLGTFLPYRNDWNGAVWIEIDRQKVGKSLVSGNDLLARWKAENCPPRNLMPIIEAAHIGNLPLASCRRVLFIHHSAPKEFRQFDIADFDEAGFEAILRTWRAGIRTDQQRDRDARGI